VGQLCSALSVSVSGYYRWRRAEPSRHTSEDAQIGARLCALHEQSRRTYGRPRLVASLRAEGRRHSPKRVARLMKVHGLRGVQRRRARVRTTQSDHALGVAANLRPGVGKGPTEPNQLWAADITYVPTEEGWLYVAAVLDQGSRRILGLAMGARLQTDLTEVALRQALAQRGSGEGVIHHSDRGVQYASDRYRTVLEEEGLTASMSRRGNCYDNAHMESFWSTLKSELTERSWYATRSDARGAIFEYVHRFYNGERLHSALGYLSPLEYEKQFT
jgi:putative transposase